MTKTQKPILVFDLDNTLILRDTAMLHCIEKCFVLSLSAVQKEAITKQDQEGHSDRIGFCTWLKSFLNLDKDAAEIWTIIKNNIGYFVILNQNAKDVLTELQQEYILVLLTNGGAVNQQKKITETGLNNFFKAKNIFISELMGVKKPDFRAFQLVEAQFAAESCFCMIGDHWENDIIGAKNFGWQAIYLSAEDKHFSVENVIKVSDLSMLLKVKLNGFENGYE